MSWNPRRFAVFVNNHTDDSDNPLLIWLTKDAQKRCISACDSEILSALRHPLPTEGLCLGLSAPVLMRNELVSSVWVVPDGHNNHYVYMQLVSQNGLEVGRICAAKDIWISIRHHPRLSELKTSHLKPVGSTTYVIDGSEDQIINLVRAAWTLLNDTVEADVTATTVTKELVSAEKKKSKKRKRPDHEVSIIDVRRRAPRGDSDESRSPVEHDHRWTVRGHWRMQPFGTGRAQRRRVWIDAYIAGPEDKPLIARTKVNVVH